MSPSHRQLEDTTPGAVPAHPSRRSRDLPREVCPGSIHEAGTESSRMQTECPPHSRKP